MSGFDLVGSFSDYYDVVSGHRKWLLNDYFFIACVKLLSNFNFFLFFADKVETLLTYTLTPP